MTNHRLILPALSALAIISLSAQEREREPYYGESYDFLSKKSPVPTDPEALAKNLKKWEMAGTKEGSRNYPKFGLMMAMTEEQLRDLVPKQTASYKPGCANCAANGLGRGDVTKAGRWFWPYKFDPLNPHIGTCSKCGMTFPNEKYATNRKKVFYSPTGKKSELPYWENPLDGKPYFIGVEVEGLGWKWMEDHVLKPLIEAYRDTGNEKYSYRASILLDEVAVKFPAYVWGADNNRYLKSAFEVKPDGTMGERQAVRHTDTRIGYRNPSEKMGGETLREAYEVFSGTAGMKKLSQELGRDVNRLYTENLLFLTDPGLAVSDLSEHSGKWKQGHPGRPAFDMGIMLGRADYLRWYINCQEVSGFKEFYADGGYPEGPGYSCLALNPRTGMRMMNGYSDPADFEVPTGEIRYQNWEFPWGKYYPDGELEDFWRRAYGFWEDIALPDGSPPTLNDDNHDSRGPSASYQDRWSHLKKSRPVLKPNMKHVILGDGEGEDQFQVQMGFGRGGAHAHQDTLGIQLYGMGHCLLDDLPYPKHIQRKFYSSALTHNTVTIDKKDQSGSNGGDVVFYAPRFEGLSAVRVNAPDAYPGLAEVYSRTLVAVTNDLKHPYVLDVFRVKGGEMHDYMIYGSSYLHPNETEISITDMKRLPGERPLMEEGMTYKVPKDYSASRHESGMPDPYGIFTDVSIGSATESFTFTHRPEKIWVKQETPSEANGFDPKKGALYIHPDKPKVGTMHHVAGRPHQKIISAKIARKPTPENVEGDFPVMILRSEPEEETLFVVVHEPYLGMGYITSVEQQPSEAGELVVDVMMPGRIDRIIMSLGDEALEYEGEGIRTDAMLAVISTTKGKEPTAWMLGGTILEFPDQELKLEKKPAKFEGVVANSTRTMDGDNFYGLELRGSNLPPEGDELKGSSLIVQNRYPGTWDGGDGEDAEPVSSGDNSLLLEKVPLRGPLAERHQQMIRPGPVRTISKSEEAEYFPVGVNWAFEIDGIRNKDGKTYAVLKADHGLIVNHDGLREIYLPHRILDGETKWWINTVASTLPLRRDEESAPLMDLGEFSIPSLPAGAKPGILHRVFGLESNSEDAEAVSSDVQETFDFLRISNDIHKYEGFLMVPADGIYTFHFRPGARGSLSLGGKVVSPEHESPYFSGNVVPRRESVKLKKGYVPINWVFKGLGGGKYGGEGCGFSFEGPGIPRTEFRPGDFFHLSE